MSGKSQRLFSVISWKIRCQDSLSATTTMPRKIRRFVGVLKMVGLSTLTSAQKGLWESGGVRPLVQFGRDFTVCTASSGSQALARLNSGDVALLLTDERMPGMTGMDHAAMGDREDMDHMTMQGFYGAYSMTRESSGTAWMPDPCRSCDRRELDFGGCRCQAFALTGDASRTDPVCELSGDHGLVTAALGAAGDRGSPPPSAEPALGLRGARYRVRTTSRQGP